MHLSKLKTAMLALLGVGILGVGLGVSGYCYPTHAAEEKTALYPHPIPVASDESQTNPREQKPSPSPRSALTGPRQPTPKEYVVQTQVFESLPDGRVRAASPYHKRAVREGGREEIPLLHKVSAHDFGETNKANVKFYEAVAAEISYVVKLKELSSGHLLLDLFLKKEDVEHQQKDKDGILISGRTLHILRKIKIGELERFVLENDGKGRPVSWVEILIIRESDNPQIPLHNSDPLPFSDGRPNSAEKASLQTELEGVWRPLRMERGGARIHEAKMDEIGKLAIEGNRLSSPDRGPLDSIWKGWFRLDSSKKPKQITIFDEGPEGELRFNGIYSLDGDDLRICLNENGQDTAIPDDFGTKEGSPFVLFYFKREKR